jgi:hypothetical protein
VGDNLLKCKEFVKKKGCDQHRGAKDGKTLHHGPCGMDLDTVLFLG